MRKMISFFLVFVIFPLSLLKGETLPAPRQVTPEEMTAIFSIARAEGVPASIVRQLIAEESGGNVNAVSHETVEGYRSRGIIQIYDKNRAELVRKFLHGSFDVYNPIHNATVGLRYLSALHKRFGNWYQACVYYNHGDVKNYPEETRAYARRIVNAE